MERLQAGVWRALLMLVLLIRLSHVGTAAESPQTHSLSLSLSFFFVIMSRRYPLALKFHDLGTTADNGKLNRSTLPIEEPAN